MFFDKIQKCSSNPQSGLILSNIKFLHRYKKVYLNFLTSNLAAVN